jgi:triosephosphate isomerase
MTVRRPLVAGNWKMNGSRAGVGTLLDGIVAGTRTMERTEIAVCPPSVFLDMAAAYLKGTAIALGAQNVSEYAAGAYTGEISGGMLRDYGCRFAIVGHSERRRLFGESDAQVAAKAVQAQACYLIPIICVGEDWDERSAGHTEAVVSRQLQAVLTSEQPVDLSRAVIAYEPVWAIGTGKTATPDQAQAVHQFLRGLVAERAAQQAQGIRILYGGSVTAENAKDLIAMPDIDGGLVGGASLKAESFVAICAAANELAG